MPIPEYTLNTEFRDVDFSKPFILHGVAGKLAQSLAQDPYKLQLLLFKAKASSTPTDQKDSVHTEEVNNAAPLLKELHNTLETGGSIKRIEADPITQKLFWTVDSWAHKRAHASTQYLPGSSRKCSLRA